MIINVSMIRTVCPMRLLQSLLIRHMTTWIYLDSGGLGNTWILFWKWTPNLVPDQLQRTQSINRISCFQVPTIQINKAYSHSLQSVLPYQKLNKGKPLHHTTQQSNNSHPWVRITRVNYTKNITFSIFWTQAVNTYTITFSFLYANTTTPMHHSIQQTKHTMKPFWG